MPETASAKVLSNYPGVDWQKCLALADNNEGLAKDLLEMFAGSFAEDVQILSDAYQQQDFSALKNQAHKIHGALCYCSIPSMKEAMKALENACLLVMENENEATIAEVNAKYIIAKQENDQLLAFLHS